MSKNQIFLFPPALPPPYFWVLVSPGVRHKKVLGWVEYKNTTVLKVHLHSKPTQGKANAELLRILACWFHQPSSAFSIVSGHTSKLKKLFYTLLS